MIIYAYTLTCYPSLIKVGQTTRDAEKRIKEQVRILPVVNGIQPYKILYEIDDHELQVNLTDKEIHKALKRYHISGEWFCCNITTLDKVIRRIANKKLEQGCKYKEIKYNRSIKKSYKIIIINNTEYKYTSVMNLCKQIEVSYNAIKTYIHRTHCNLEYAINYQLNKIKRN